MTSGLALESLAEVGEPIPVGGELGVRRSTAVVPPVDC